MVNARAAYAGETAEYFYAYRIDTDPEWVPQVIPTATVTPIVVTPSESAGYFDDAQGWLDREAFVGREPAYDAAAGASFLLPPGFYQISYLFILEGSDLGARFANFTFWDIRADENGGLDPLGALPNYGASFCSLQSTAATSLRDIAGSDALEQVGTLWVPHTADNVPARYAPFVSQSSGGDLDLKGYEIQLRRVTRG